MVDFPEVFVESRAQWRAWLEANHVSSTGVWVVTWKRSTGRPQVTYEDLVEEGVCFGWVDSVAKRFGEERSGLRMTPRKRRSRWSRSNRERVARLQAAGLMSPAGLAVVERAKADGTWDSAP
ncbi:MAG TPA: hypothetical protein VMI11_10125 [Actinomycetes bacterium]|nr:hypothetical protein [Actinomycetes bacterium]